MGVDNHYRNAAVLRELVELLQVAAVIHKPASLFAVMLHEVVFEHTETLSHALTNGDARHHHDKLAPAITAVEFKHRLDVNVGLTRTCFHLDVEAHTSLPFGE